MSIRMVAPPMRMVCDQATGLFQGGLWGCCGGTGVGRA